MWVPHQLMRRGADRRTGDVDICYPMRFYLPFAACISLSCLRSSHTAPADPHCTPPLQTRIITVEEPHILRIHILYIPWTVTTYILSDIDKPFPRTLSSTAGPNTDRVWPIRYKCYKNDDRSRKQDIVTSATRDGESGTCRECK
ncbi:hypothetical protein VTO73DRAFT_8136 [Trametes versicolor]